jgi:hypothetical protein
MLNPIWIILDARDFVAVAPPSPQLGLQFHILAKLR